MGGGTLVSPPMSLRKIDAWHEAGLIDGETRARLIAYEAEHARPLALWAVFGIGALAIGLGLISIVAANWEDIPAQLRLGVHLVLLAGALLALWLREDALAKASPWAVEALVFVAAVLGLTFFGHLGQVYQTSSPLWQPLAIWLALFAPLMLFNGRSWAVAALLVGGAIYCAWDFNFTQRTFDEISGQRTVPDFLVGLVTTVPVLFAPLGGYLRPRSARIDFWRRIEQLALTYAVFGGSAFALMASVGVLNDGDVVGGSTSQFTRSAVAILAGVLVVIARPGISGQMSGAIIVGSGVTLSAALAVNDTTLAAGILFMGLWFGIAAAALYAGWRGVFQFAVGVIALRLIILSFELASDLLMSGFGLVIAGLMILGVAYGAYRVSQDFAPPVEDNSDETGESA